MLTEEQRAARLTCIGASDIAAVAGLNRYRTPYQVWGEKRNLTEPEPENEYTRAGHALQPVVAYDYFARDTRAQVLTVADWVEHCHGRKLTADEIAEAKSIGLLRAEKRPHFGASLDYVAEFADGAAALEVKTTSDRNRHRWGDTGTDAVPEEYLCQVQWQMMVSGLPVAYIAVLIGGVTFRWYRIERSQALIEALAETGEKFWRDHVIGGKPPPTEPGSPDATAELRRIFPRAEKGKVVELASDDPAVVGIAAARNRLQAAETDYETAKQSMMQRIGDAAKAVGPWGAVRWQNMAGRKTTDWKTLAADLKITSEVEKYTRVGPATRQMVVTLEGGEEDGE